MVDTDKYIKTRTIFAFWHSDDLDTMTHLRKSSFDCLYKFTNCNIELITPSRLKDFILKDSPLHPGFEYLSAVHKSDYLRTYFMNFHGGGYADIKVPGGDWNKAFDDLLVNTKMVANGYREEQPSHIAYHDSQIYYDKLIGNGSYIIRPQTEFTIRWFNELNELLDKKLDLLKANPAKHEYDKAEEGNGYPIEWNEMLGRIFHKISVDFTDKFLYSVPKPVLVYYK